MSTLLAKWLNGTTTEKELELLRSEYDLEELSKILKAQESLELETTDGNAIWQRIEDEKKMDSVPKPKQRKSLWILGVIGLIIISFSLYIMYNGKVIITAPNGQVKEHYMADNTKISVSPNSQISYKEKDWINNRSIKLEGQAYFQVEKGTEFTVETAEGKVTVLGTEFEISERDNYMKVQCMEGSVRFEKSSKDYVILKQGDKAIINNSVISNVEKHEFKNAEFLSGNMKYESISFTDLGEELERFYNVEVTLKEEFKNQNYTGILLLDDLDKAISYISKTMDCEVQKDSRTITFY